MKIAINKCYGGFDLSDKAHERLTELGVKCYDLFKDIPKGTGEPWIAKEKIFGWKEYSSNFNDNEHRTNPLLIQVIEELGKDANGVYGDIVIVDVPDGVEWEIDDYDGYETVEEQHRRW